MAIELPCFKQATSISIALWFRGRLAFLPPAVAGVFSRLTDLWLEGVRFQDPSALGDAISSAWCPCLKTFHICHGRGLERLAVSSNSLVKPDLQRLHGLRDSGSSPWRRRSSRSYKWWTASLRQGRGNYHRRLCPLQRLGWWCWIGKTRLLKTLLVSATSCRISAQAYFGGSTGELTPQKQPRALIFLTFDSRHNPWGDIHAGGVFPWLFGIHESKSSADAVGSSGAACHH